MTRPADENSMRLLLASTAALGVCAALLVGPAFGQVLYGTLVGNVSDSSNAAVPGATVTLTHAETNLSRETASRADGSYRFVNLQPGSYTIKISMAGFKEFVKEGVPVTPNTVSRVDVTLEVGQLTETVTVQSERALLQTDKADLHSELSSKEVTSLPLGAYRNYQTLLNLVPGATPGDFQNAVADTPARSLTTNINGANRNSNNTRLDGTANIFIWLPHHAAYVAPAETVETVNITTNSFDAEQGNAGGAAITVQTKSGTNEFRGSLFELHEDESLRARNFFNPGPKPNSSRDIAGGTLGGPIVKNKLFFFAGWEGTFQRTARFLTGTVATEAVRRGDFSGLPVTLYDPATGNPNGSGRQPFPGNIIPADRISPIAAKMLALVPAPTTSGASNNYSRSATQKLDRHNYDFKLNYNRSSAHQIWAKYSQMNADTVGEFFLGEAGGPCICEGGGSGTASVDVRLVSVGHTWTLGPSWLLDGHFGFSDHDQAVRGPDYGQNFGLDVLGIPGTNGPDPRQGGKPQFQMTGYTQLGNSENWSPLFRNEHVYTFNSGLTHIRDKHEIRLGFDIVRMELNAWQPEVGAGPRGRFNFTGTATALRGGAAPNQFNAFADFLLGLPISMEKSLQYELLTGREWQMGFYVRDRWQVSRSVTISAGLRFEHYPLMTRQDRGIEVYDPDTNTLRLGGRGGNPKDLGIKVQYPRVNPRLGIAWRINDSNVLRAGYGMTVDPLPLSRPLRGQYPLTIAQTFPSELFGPFRPLALGIPEFTGPDLSTGVISIPGTASMRTPYEDHLNRTYIQSWNLSYERKLPGDIAANVSYVGTLQTHQIAYTDINAAEPGRGNAGRPLAVKFGRTAETRVMDGGVSSNYHALQVALNRPFTKGLFLKGAYTWSKAMNWVNDNGENLMWSTPSQLGRNYARASYDRPNIFQLGVIADLPFARNSKSVLGAIVKNWQINGIASAFSGTPFTVTASGASVNAPGNTQTADQVAPVKKLGGIGSGNPYYYPSSFAAVTEVRFGNMGRNALRGPSQYNLDLSLFRRFPINGRWNLEARIEAFNVTNTPKFSNPNGDRASGAFMTITSTDLNRPERYVRLGLRLSF